MGGIASWKWSSARRISSSVSPDSDRQSVRTSSFAANLWAEISLVTETVWRDRESVVVTGVDSTGHGQAGVPHSCRLLARNRRLGAGVRGYPGMSSYARSPIQWASVPVRTCALNARAIFCVWPRRGRAGVHAPAT